MKVHLILPMALLVFMSAGCAIHSPESRMSEAGQAPIRWSATPQARQGIDDRWVERFGGRDLKALVAEAYEANRDLHAAAARVERAAVLAKAAGVDARPQLNAALSGSVYYWDIAAGRLLVLVGDRQRRASWVSRRRDAPVPPPTSSVYTSAPSMPVDPGALERPTERFRTLDAPVRGTAADYSDRITRAR